MWTNSTGVKSRIFAFRDGPARRNALGELKMQRDLQRQTLDQACVRAVYCASFFARQRFVPRRASNFRCALVHNQGLRLRFVDFAARVALKPHCQLTPLLFDPFRPRPSAATEELASEAVVAQG